MALVNESPWLSLNNAAAVLEKTEDGAHQAYCPSSREQQAGVGQFRWLYVFLQICNMDTHIVRSQQKESNVSLVLSVNDSQFKTPST